MYAIVQGSNDGKRHPHLQRMLHYKCNRSTADIRLAFGIQSITPREHIIITLDRCGFSLADKMRKEGMASQYSKMNVEARMSFAKTMLTGILGGIKGNGLFYLQ
jgi:hypothetical protein